MKVSVHDRKLLHQIFNEKDIQMIDEDDPTKQQNWEMMTRRESVKATLIMAFLVSAFIMSVAFLIAAMVR